MLAQRLGGGGLVHRPRVISASLSTWQSNVRTRVLVCDSVTKTMLSGVMNRCLGNK